MKSQSESVDLAVDVVLLIMMGPTNSCLSSLLSRAETRTIENGDRASEPGGRLVTNFLAALAGHARGDRLRILPN